MRLVVPHGYGYKSVKFLQHIRLTNDYRANDTYAAIDEGEEGNDPAAIQKTFTTTDAMIGAEKIRHAYYLATLRLCPFDARACTQGS